MSESDYVESSRHIDALTLAIRELKRADRWRLHRRNKGAIKNLEKYRSRIQAAQSNR